MICVAYIKISTLLIFVVLCNLLNIKEVYCDPMACSVNCPPNSTCSVRTPCLFGETSNGTDSCSYFISRTRPSSFAVTQELKLPNMYVWIYSLTSAFIISVAGIWGYLFLPLMTGAYRDHVMNVLIGLSFGSLVTSGVCQLIPEAYELGKTKKPIEYLNVAVFSMLGIWLTWLLQSVASIIQKEIVESEKMNVELKPQEIKGAKDVQEKPHNGCSVYTFPAGADNLVRPVAGEIHKMNPENELPIKLLQRSSFGSYAQMVKPPPTAKLSKLATVILASDCVNNFMDGISIGAGYSYYLSTGIKLTTAIAFEEYTHKLGDFAIVFQTGISMRRVLFWNYTTSCACFIGLIIGIVIGNMHWSHYIFSFASGLFLFISLANMIPEMQNILDNSLKQSKKSGCITLLEQNVGFFMAFIILTIISITF